MKTDKRITNAYNKWIQKELAKSKMALFFTFQFNENLSSDRKFIEFMNQKVNTLYAAIGAQVATLNMYKKRQFSFMFFSAPDIPTAKHDKKIETTYINDGYHIHAILCIYQAQESPDDVIKTVSKAILKWKSRTNLSQFYIKEIDDAENFPADYITKSIGRRQITSSDIQIYEYDSYNQ